MWRQQICKSNSFGTNLDFDERLPSDYFVMATGLSIRGSTAQVVGDKLCLMKALIWKE
jgi:hypothetical protein